MKLTKKFHGKKTAPNRNVALYSQQRHGKEWK